MVLFSGHDFMVFFFFFFFFFIVEVGWDGWALAIFSQEKKNF